MTFENFQNWLTNSFNAILSWIDSLGNSIGLTSLSTILVFLTILSIILAYTIRPAVGKSDSAVDNKQNRNKSTNNNYED